MNYLINYLIIYEIIKLGTRLISWNSFCPQRRYVCVCRSQGYKLHSRDI